MVFEDAFWLVLDRYIDYLLYRTLQVWILDDESLTLSTVLEFNQVPGIAVGRTAKTGVQVEPAQTRQHEQPYITPDRQIF